MPPETLGRGSIAPTVPDDVRGVVDFDGSPITPLVTSDYEGPIDSNGYDSSLAFPFIGDPYSAVMHAHPLSLKAGADGLALGHAPAPVFIDGAPSDPASDRVKYEYRSNPDITVGLSGLDVPEARMAGRGDWTTTADWGGELQATFGHGLPFSYFNRQSDRDLTITLRETGQADLPAGVPPQLDGWTGPGRVWYAQDGVIGLTINGVSYGIFGPSGTQWTFTPDGLRSDLGGADYASVAVLPDASIETLETYRAHAYTHVTGSVSGYDVDEASGTVTSTFTLETEQKEVGEGIEDTPLMALYRHQAINTDAELSGFTYGSARGEMRVLEGATFATVMDANALLPTMPFLGDDATADRVRALIEDESRALTERGGTIAQQDTYFAGKEMARLSELAQIANQLGQTDARDTFLDAVRAELADWFDAGDGTGKLFAYNDTWDTLQGYPASFGSDDQINDHHFHYGYFISAAATLAELDPDWAAQGEYGAIVDELIADVANTDRESVDYTYLRNFDPYAGHSWAAGHGAFASGNNQESSSEALNFASSVARWGAATGQDALRDLGVYLHTVESEAVQQYWFDVDDEVFPEDYPYNAVGLIWGDGGDHRTFFGADPEFIRGINFLPMTGGALFLGENPEHILANVEQLEAIRGGDPIQWRDLIWEYTALADPDLARAQFEANQGYESEGGNSRADTLTWLSTLQTVGTLASDIGADSLFAAAFEKDGVTSYIAYNPDADDRDVTFDDGTVLSIEGRSIAALDGGAGTVRTYSLSDGPSYPTPPVSEQPDPVPTDPDPEPDPMSSPEPLAPTDPAPEPPAPIEPEVEGPSLFLGWPMPEVVMTTGVENGIWGTVEVGADTRVEIVIQHVESGRYWTPDGTFSDDPVPHDASIVDASGHWRVMTAPGAPGEYALSVRATDASGNDSTTGTTFGAIGETLVDPNGPISALFADISPADTAIRSSGEEDDDTALLLSEIGGSAVVVASSPVVDDGHRTEEAYGTDMEASGLYPQFAVDETWL